MTISIDWGTSVINVHKADMTLIQSNPTEIYELNLNDFRLTLKSLEDSEEGMPFLKTHDHNTTVDVGGVTLARVVNLLPPYTVTFEDGQYAVNLVGANSNVGDRVNVNQVSVRSANSAGLVTSRGIEAIEYKGGVTIDIVNGVTGSVYPIGTARKPVSNVDDANIIAEANGFEKFYINNNITFVSGDNLDDKIIVGENINQSTIVLNSGVSTNGTQILSASISGVLDGDTEIYGCNITDLEYVQGNIRSCLITGDIRLAGVSTVALIDCTDGDADGHIPTIDMGGSGRNLVIARYSGDIKIKNLTGNQYVSIDMISGKIWLDSTVTNGYFFIRGTTIIDDQSTGTVIDTEGMMNTETLADAMSPANISTQFNIATSQISSRNVDVGKINYVRIKVKKSSDTDWSNPISDKKLYWYYETMGDTNPIEVKESD